jgi:hypothetical protein
VTEAATLRRDRRRFHAHAATGLLGFLGWLAVIGLERLFVDAIIPWLLVGFSLLLCVSGVLAIMIGRTFLTGPADPGDGTDPYADVGDALGSPGIHTLDFNPAYTRAVAPYAHLLIGLCFLALSCYWVFTGGPAG